MREPHEGLVGWMTRSIAQIPVTLANVARGFALEVVAVVAGSFRAVFGLVPGGRRIVHVHRAVRDQANKLDLPTIRTQPERGAARPRAPRAAAEQWDWEQRRATLRRRLRLVLVVLLAISVVMAWIAVPASDAFRIRHVEVTGAASVGDLEARMRVDELLRGETVFTVDEDAIARSLEELPFVRSARVERHLPGGLELHIVEYRPLALGYNGRFWLVARDGRILAKASHKEWRDRVPIVTLRRKDLKPGMRVGDEPALQLLAAREPGSTLVLENVTAEEFRIMGTLEGGIQVRFGRADQLVQKVLVAEKMLAEARRHRLDLVYIDVSVPSRPAVCAREDAGCLMARVGRDDADGGETKSDATTPEELGGDEPVLQGASEADEA